MRRPPLDEFFTNLHALYVAKDDSDNFRLEERTRSVLGTVLALRSQGWWRKVPKQGGSRPISIASPLGTANSLPSGDGFTTPPGPKSWAGWGDVVYVDELVGARL